MKIRPGCIVPINYELWPKKSGAILMAMVMECDRQWVSLCPVHCNIEAASFLDLVITPDMSPLKTLLVIMGNQAAGLPISAINPEVFQAANSPRVEALAMSDEMCAKMLGDVYYVLANQNPDNAFKVSRGRFLPPKSKDSKLAGKFLSDWDSFITTAWSHELGKRGFAKAEIMTIEKELHKTAHKILPPVAINLPPREPGKPRYSRSPRSIRSGCAGRIGSLQLPDWTENDEKPEDTAKKYQTPVEIMKEKIAAHLSKAGYDVEAEMLREASFQDLLKLLLRLFPYKIAD